MSCCLGRRGDGEREVGKGSPGLRKAIDVLVDPTVPNAKRVKSALCSFLGSTAITGTRRDDPLEFGVAKTALPSEATHESARTSCHDKPNLPRYLRIRSASFVNSSALVTTLLVAAVCAPRSIRPRRSGE